MKNLLSEILNNFSFKFSIVQCSIEYRISWKYKIATIKSINEIIFDVAVIYVIQHGESEYDKVFLIKRL